MDGKLSPERVKYHELFEAFTNRLEPGCLLYDVGKSHLHDYSERFAAYNYRTIDRDKNKKPDILLDVESMDQFNAEQYLPVADALLCNGVVEQCDNPFQMIKACNAMLRMGGFMLFGSVLLGYPPHSYDRFRFTDKGALSALVRDGFAIPQAETLQRNGVPSYMYAICQKVGNP